MSTVNNAATPAAPWTAVAARYIGKPFAYGGRGPEAYDCYGLAMAIYQDMGIALPEYASTDDKSLIHDMIGEGRARFAPISQAAPGAIVTFAIHPRYVTHIGVVLDDGYRFVHITEKTRVSVACLGSLEWRWRIRGFYLWKG